MFVMPVQEFLFYARQKEDVRTVCFYLVVCGYDCILYQAGQFSPSTCAKTQGNSDCKPATKTRFIAETCTNSAKSEQSTGIFSISWA